MMAGDVARARERAQPDHESDSVPPSMAMNVTLAALAGFLAAAVVPYLFHLPGNGNTDGGDTLGQSSRAESDEVPVDRLVKLARFSPSDSQI